MFHKTIDTGFDTPQSVFVGTVQAYRGSQGAAGHFQGTDQHRHQGACPAALVGAPAVVDRFAESHRDRAKRQGCTVYLNGLADTGVVQIFSRDAADGVGRNIAYRCGPVGAVFSDVFDQFGEAGSGINVLQHMAFVIGIDAKRMVHLKMAFQCRNNPLGIMGHGLLATAVPDQRFGGFKIAQVEAIGADQIGRGGTIAEKVQVEPGSIILVQHAVDQREHKGRIGLGTDRHPFGRGRACYGLVRLDLNPFITAHPGVGMAGDGAGAAGGVNVGTDRQHEAAVGGICCDGKSTVPELAVEVFGMHTFNPLAGAEAEIDRPPGCQECGKGAHVIHRRATVAEGSGGTGQPLFIDQPFGANREHLIREHLQRFIPRDRDKARVFLSAFFGVGAFHRLEDAVRVIGLLNQPVRLDTGAPLAGV